MQLEKYPTLTSSILRTVPVRASLIQSSNELASVLFVMSSLGGTSERTYSIEAKCKFRKAPVDVHPARTKAIQTVSHGERFGTL